MQAKSTKGTLADLGEPELLYWIGISGTEDQFLKKLKTGIKAMRHKKIWKNGARIEDSSYRSLYKRWATPQRGEAYCRISDLYIKDQI